MLTLDDILKMPANPDEDYLQRKGLLPPKAPPAAAPTIAPVANAPANIAPMVKPPLEAGGPEAPHDASLGIKPMAPLPAHLTFNERQALPTVSPGVAPGSSAYFENLIGREADRRANPWGSPENHPGLIGQIGHAAGRIGNIALDAFAPATATLIPGTDLNRHAEELGNERKLLEAKKEETAEEAVKQRPELAEAAGALKERLEEQREQAAEEKEKSREASAEKIATGKETSAEKIAGGKEASAEKVAEGKTKSAETIARERAESNERIAVGHNLAMTEVARIRAQSANDPDKLTNTMKTMKQQAVATLPSIDRALDETEKVAAKLGPVAGRWNEFWQGKVGANDPDFAHYKDEIAFISTAVTLAHARGRMSNELFEHFQKMFDAGKQDPANMVQALNVAKEWLTDYSKLGEPVAHAPAAAPATNPPQGKTTVYDPQGEPHYVKSDKLEQFLKDPKYKGWTKNAPASPSAP